MNSNALTFLEAEENSLLKLIKETPKDAVITLGSLRARLEEVKSLLGQCSIQQPPFEEHIPSQT